MVIDSAQFDVGPRTLRSGYGTNASVAVTIAPVPNPLNIDSSNIIQNCDGGVTGNCSRGRNGENIEMIVLHYTAGNNADDAIKHWIPSTLGKPSAHYVIERNGKIYQVVDDANTAFHAGVDLVRDGIIKQNQRSIGIEIVNWGWFTQNASGEFLNYKGGSYNGNDVVQVSSPWTPNPALTAYSY